MRAVHQKFVWVACVLGLAVSGAGGANADLSTPKKAATAFALALQRGDFGAVKSVTTGSESDYKLMETLSAMTAASNKVHDAAISKFGEEGRKIAAAISTGDPEKIPLEIEASEERVSGDSALIIAKGTPEANAVKLTKVGGEWKVDLAHYPLKEKLVQQSPMFDATAKLFTQIAGDLSAGKYHSALEAGQDIQQRLMTLQMALRQSQRPATTPAR
jgi:hypothetical protein